MIELQNIYKAYDNLEVLRGVSLSVGRGEIVAIVGPSGAGKTTLLQIAGSLDRPDSGSVSYDGTDITRLKEKRLAEFRNRNIGFIFQFHELLPEFTAIENVAMPALIAGRKRREALEEARKLLILLGLEDRLNHRPAELSGGEKQRTAIARALINNPRIVLADEPTGSLDSRNREEIHRIIADLCATRNQTFLIVTHDPTLASIAHRVVRMEDGHISAIAHNTDPQESAQSDLSDPSDLSDLSDLSDVSDQSDPSDLPDNSEKFADSK
ncbi:MAG: ABC transporter ATP-binding protein [Muribaculaceae bacterium]|nr:ABC transporter ATP-binding protein [Muribaculaceae bacterium]